MSMQRSMSTRTVLRLLKQAPALFAGLLGGLVFPAAQGAVTDVAQAPLLTASGTPVKPNLMFILDDSGSMDSRYLPEAAPTSSNSYGFWSSQCNGLAYNPASNYTVPVDAAGNPYANPSTNFLALDASANTNRQRNVTSSPVVLVSSGSITINISGSNLDSSGSTQTYYIGDAVTVFSATTPSLFMTGTVTGWSTSSSTAGRLIISITYASGTGSLSNPRVGSGAVMPNYWYYAYTGTQPRLAYTYDSAGNVINSTTFYKECYASIGNAPGVSVFNKVNVIQSSSEAQNYAIWYTYYRTRMLMMKTVISQAFKDIDDKFRVGYTTILNTVASEANNTDFLDIRDFDASQKSSFYSDFNAAVPGGYTPLRGAISNAGKYFAKKAPSQTRDPVQYSCQKNYAILATDGAWNTNNETATYGPYKLDGSSVGQQDSTVARPFQDASQGGGSGGSSNSLADVAMYYYATDLRSTALGNCAGALGTDVCANNVKPLGKDTAEWQHMTTFTMNLGQNGTLKYDPNYEKQTSGDYFNLLQNTRQWPNPSTEAQKVDDLWHAAVNGRGTYFNAADPAMVSQGLKSALSTIGQETARGSAAATSTLKPVAGDNQAFIARFTSQLWVGDLRAYRIDVNTGEVKTVDSNGVDIAEWSAAAKLRTKTGRRVLYAKAGDAPGSALRAFDVSDADLVAEMSNKCVQLSQCSILNTTDKALANQGAQLINYLRGTENTVFRTRSEVLGDIVNSAPAYVGAPPFVYQDAGYLDFYTANKTRRGVVYVGANDGMLHAFDAATGDELWAFVPPSVRGQLYKLADYNYASNHQFFVDGSPNVSDVYIGGVWRTLLVAGLGAGGRAYFALDVTDPANPKYMWEFTDANLGLAIPTPLVVKRRSGDWVVALSSGYNNVGDGKGHLFMVNPATGAKLLDIATSAGSADTPSGLGPLAAWVEADNDATATRFYAGDNAGNVWRFDTEGLVEPKNSALLLAQLRVGGVPQPVTTAPQLALVNSRGYKFVAVYIGTGRMLGLSDLGTVGTQSIYGIKDRLTSEGWGDIRASGALVSQSLSTVGNTRVATPTPVDWSTKAGWMVDLPDAGERINVEMSLIYSTLVAASNVPKSLATCGDADHGYAWLYYLDIANGANAGQNSATKMTGSMIVGLSPIYLKKGAGVIVNYSFRDPPPPPEIPTPKKFLPLAKKTNWRELLDQ